jgi:hypothetical protein
MSIRGKVAIVGVGMIPFGELFHKSFEDMLREWLPHRQRRDEERSAWRSVWGL